MKTKHRELYERLKKDILEGKYNALLPSEVALVRRFGVSRTTVQRALRDFEREGLVIKIKRKGSFVIPPEERNKTISLVFPSSIPPQDKQKIVTKFSACANELGYRLTIRRNS